MDLAAAGAGSCAKEISLSSGGNSRHQGEEERTSREADGASCSGVGRPQSIGARSNQQAKATTTSTNSVRIDGADQLATQASGPQQQTTTTTTTRAANCAGTCVSDGGQRWQSDTTPTPVSTVRRELRQNFKPRSGHSAAAVNQFNRDGGCGCLPSGGDGNARGDECARANWRDYASEHAKVAALERHNQTTTSLLADRSLILEEDAQTSRRRAELPECEPELAEIDSGCLDQAASNAGSPQTKPTNRTITKRREVLSGNVAREPDEQQVARVIAKNRHELERSHQTFWTRLSNLSRSILQQQSLSESTSSGVGPEYSNQFGGDFGGCAFLAPEVLSYLESTQKHTDRPACEESNQASNSNMTKTSGVARRSAAAERQGANEPVGGITKQIERDLERGRTEAASAQDVTGKHQMKADEQPEAHRKAQVRSGGISCEKMIKKDELVRIQRQQAFKTNDSNEFQVAADQQQQPHQKKSSLTTTNATNTTTTTTTTTTTIRSSSASSLSSCILSESMSTRSNEVRVKWSKKMDFLLSIIGFAVDLANIWRFPYLVYKNGGGVFLIPYLIMLIFGGIPLFFLELCLGQYVKKGPITVWNKICPYMKGVGYCSILITWYVSFYYNVLIAWSVYFIYRSISSFGQKMPWEDCDNPWNSPTTCVSISQLKDLCASKANMSLESCRKEMFSSTNVSSPASEFFVKELSQIDQSTGLSDMGYLRPELVLCLLVVYTLHYFSLFRGLETSGKVVWVTATAPYIILSILMVRGLFLPGAFKGIEFYIWPRLEKLPDPQVWIDAAGQVFYSIGVGFGVHLTYASFNSHNNNCYRDCLMTSAVNALTSIYSGLVVFIYLGYMATNMGIDIDKVASEGYSLVFEVYPEALTTLPFARFWSILFFIMLLTLGIDSAMGGLEAVITGLEDEFKFAKRLTRGQLTGLVIVSSFLPALISCTQGGAYTLFWFDIYSAGISLLFSALFETIGVVYCYGLDKFILNIESMLGKRPPLFYIICWLFISPLFLLVIIVMSIITAQTPVYRGYTFPVWSVWLGWFLAFSSVAAVPVVAIMTLFSNRGKHKAISVTPSKSPRKANATGAAGGGSKSASRKSTPSHGAHHHQICRKPMMTMNLTGEGNQMGGAGTTSSVINLPADQQHHCYREGARIEEEML